MARIKNIKIIVTIMVPKQVNKYPIKDLYYFFLYNVLTLLTLYKKKKGIENRLSVFNLIGSGSSYFIFS